MANVVQKCEVPEPEAAMKAHAAWSEYGRLKGIRAGRYIRYLATTIWNEANNTHIQIPLGETTP